MAPGSLAGAARLVLGRARDLRGPNGLDDLRSPVGERTPPLSECTPDGDRTPSVGDRTPSAGENGVERAPSSAGDANGEGANSIAGDVGMASRVFCRMSK